MPERTGVERQHPLVLLGRIAEALRRRSVVVSPAEQEVVVDVRVRRAVRLRGGLAAGQQGHPQRQYDRARDVVLDREHVRQL